MNPGRSHATVRRRRRSEFSRAAAALALLALPLLGSGRALSHEDLGEAVVTAVRLRPGEKVRLDGRFDEPFWAGIPPAGGFRQRDPDYGAPATYDSEVRFCYDDENLYIAVRCFDGEPERIIRRLSRNETDMYTGDTFGIFIDPRHDHRTGVKFGTNPSGMREDSSRYDDYLRDNSWNGYWWVEARIDSLGWTAEFRIPFKNFRFPEVLDPVWGLNMQRNFRRRNENQFWRLIQRDDGSIIRMSKLGHLQGIHGIRAGRRFELIPYVLEGVDRSRGTDRSATTESGLDLKVAITPNITLDAAMNPDFAQVEADLDEINLTRFPTRFPEQRPFFVEGNHVFLTPMELYFSRRIGARADILGGGKITGKAGPWSLGGVVARTGDWTYFGLQEDDPALEDATFAVARVKRDVGSKSNVGVLFGSKTGLRNDHRVLGVDLAIRPGDILFINAQVAGTWQGGPSEGHTGAFLEFERRTDRSGVRLRYERFAPDFDVNAIGFIRKELYRGGDRPRLDLVFSPRPRTPAVRQVFFSGWMDAQKPLLTARYLDAQRARFPGTQFHADFLEEKRGLGGGAGVNVEFDSGWAVNLRASRQRRLDISGPYDADTLAVSVATPRQRSVSVTANAFVDDFYNFDARRVSRERALGLDAAILPVTQWRLEARLRHSRSFDPAGRLEGRVWLGSLRSEYSFSSETFLRVFVQVRSDRTPGATTRSWLVSNVFGWEFRRGSRLFVAFNESRDDAGGAFGLNNQALVLKLAHQIDM